MNGKRIRIFPLLGFEIVELWSIAKKEFRNNSTSISIVSPFFFSVILHTTFYIMFCVSVYLYVFAFYKYIFRLYLCGLHFMATIRIPIFQSQSQHRWLSKLVLLFIIGNIFLVRYFRITKSYFVIVVFIFAHSLQFIWFRIVASVFRIDFDFYSHYPLKCRFGYWILDYWKLDASAIMNCVESYRYWYLSVFVVKSFIVVWYFN